MKKIKTVALKPYLLGFSFVCIILLLSSFKLGAFNKSTSKKQVNFPVNSLVSSLAIADIEVKEYFVVLTLRNDSDKIITAFELSTSGVILRSEMVGSDKVMKPGDMQTKLCELPTSANPEGITVLAVVYEDGTSEGVAKFVKQIFDARAGTQAQLTRILPLFRDALVTSKTMSLVQKREAMKLKLEQLPVEEEEGQSLEFRVGLHDEKEDAMTNLKELERIVQERGEDIARQVLPIMIDTYEKRNLAILNSLKQAPRGCGRALYKKLH